MSVVIDFQNSLKKTTAHDYYGEYIKAGKWVDSLSRENRSELFKYFRQQCEKTGEAREKIDIILTLVAMNRQDDVLNLAQKLYDDGKQKHGDYIFSYIDGIVFKEIEKGVLNDFYLIVDNFYNNDNKNNLEHVKSWLDGLSSDLRKRLYKKLKWEFVDTRNRDREIKCLKVLKLIQDVDVKELIESEANRAKYINDYEIIKVISNPNNE